MPTTTEFISYRSPKKSKLVKLYQDFYDILISGGGMMSDSRLFKMLYYLLDRERATAPELAAEFEVSTKIGRAHV